MDFSQELVPVRQQVIGGQPVRAVSARELHAALQVGKDFTSWVKVQIERARLASDRDYLLTHIGEQGSWGGSNRLDYLFTVEAAKHVAMMTGTERGFVVREYFIACERRAQERPAPEVNRVLSDPTALRELLLDYTEKVLTLEAQNSELRPKAEFYDMVADAANLQSIEAVAKILGTGRNRLFRFLRDRRILQPNNLPFQEHIDADRFVVVQHTYKDSAGESHACPTTKVTGKGVIYLQREFALHGHVQPGPTLAYSSPCHKSGAA